MFVSTYHMATLLALACLSLASFAYADFPDCVDGPLANTTVCDTSATPFERARALVSLFTLEEKINNTGNTSPGVPRIGLPPYQYVYISQQLNERLSLCNTSDGGKKVYTALRTLLE